jgi:hypothetical protein
MFNVDSDIKEGDIGFIFPLTKLLHNHLFYQVSYNPLVKEGLSESNTYLHLFPKDPDEPLRIDIRNGIFIAPKDKMLNYNIRGHQFRESCEDYFVKFFMTMNNANSSWFDQARLKNWLSRHCVFYDNETRTELLNILRNKQFVSVVNHFTNKNYDNLALSQLPGRLKPSEFYVTHSFENMPKDDADKLKPDTFNLTLFEWEKE